MFEPAEVQVDSVAPDLAPASNTVVSRIAVTDHLCPICGLVTLRRSGRKGLWEKLVLPRFGIFPWRCSRCRERFRLSDRGAGYLRVRGKSTLDADNIK